MRKTWCRRIAPPLKRSLILAILSSLQRRDESIQRVPISIQALSPITLEQHQVQSFDDYTKLLPSVSFQTLGPGKSQLFFRGVTSGSEGDALSTLPTAGVYLDDTPVTTIGGLRDVHIYDVARVEALSGPKGTLFGASSLSGTLRILTNKPDPSAFKAGYDLQPNKFGKREAGGSAEGFVNVPLSRQPALRVVGYYQRAGGYIDNTLGNRTYQRPHTLADGTVVNSPLTVNIASLVQNNFNPVDTYGGRIALGNELNDNWTVTPSITAQEQMGRGPFLYDPKVGDLKIYDFLQGTQDDERYQAALAARGKIGNWDLVNSGGYMQRRSIQTQDYSDCTVAYDAYPDYTYFQNANGTAVDPTQFEKYDQKSTKQTHEVQFSFPTGERFNITAGLFYQRQTDLFQTFFYVPGLAGTVQAPAYDLEDLGRYYRDYVALTGHFDRVAPGMVRRVEYGRMVANTEPEVRRLLDYCNLPFEAGCLAFWQNNRVMRTASSEQVRQPIFASSVGYWRHFAPYFVTLISAIGTELVPE